MFCKLDVRRKSIVTLALSQDNRKIVVRYFVNQAPGLQQFQYYFVDNKLTRLPINITTVSNSLCP